MLTKPSQIQASGKHMCVVLMHWNSVSLLHLWETMVSVLMSVASEDDESVVSTVSWKAVVLVIEASVDEGVKTDAAVGLAVADPKLGDASLI